MTSLKKTPLNDWHKEHKAKTAPFAGWDMPIQYAGIIKEHEHTRTKVSVFDICHMGEFFLRGEGTREALGKVVTHNLVTLLPGKCRYGFLLNDNAGVIDDLIVYCMGEDDYMLVVNGACEDKDFDRIKSIVPDSLHLENASARIAKIDVQGPLALEALEAALGSSWSHLKYFNHEKTTFDGAELIVSRTGYTGELGYELYVDSAKALALWEKLVAQDIVEPAGLGARDTLRLEMGLPLYGHDLDDDHTPVEAGYEWLLNSEAEYAGKTAINREPREKLVALSIDGRRSARHGDPVLLLSGEEVGRVTSGSFAPTLGKSIALAWIAAEYADRNSFEVKGARTTLKAERADLPFYTEGTARKKLS